MSTADVAIFRRLMYLLVGGTSLEEVHHGEARAGRSVVQGHHPWLHI